MSDLQIVDARANSEAPGYTMLGTCSNCLSQSLVTYELGVDKRTILKCPVCGGLHKFGLAPYQPVQGLDLKCVCGGELKKLDGDFILCEKCNDAKAALNNEVSELKGDKDNLLAAVKLAYRKYHLQDGSVGWDELSSELLDSICNAIGTDAYAEWITKVKEDMEK